MSTPAYTILPDAVSAETTLSDSLIHSEDKHGNLHWSDYVVFAVVLLISLGIGIYQACSGGRQKTNDEYLIGNRSMGMIPICISLIVSYISTITLLGYPAEMFAFGVQYYWFTLGIFLGIILVVTVTIPVLYPLKLTSVNEYLWLRYESRIIQYIGLFGVISGNVFFLGNIFYGPAVAIEAVSGVDTWITIVIIGLVAMVYTSIGGFKAVIYTDCFQCVIMYAGIIAVLVQAVISVGGIENVWNLNMEWGRLEFFEFDINPTTRITFWGAVFGNALTVMTVYGFSQTAVQRIGSLPTRTRANWAMLGMLPGNILMQTLACLCGLSMFAYYADKGCDPKNAGHISSYNQLMPYFVSDIFSIPVIPGLFIAALFAASLSSASTSMNGSATVIWKDAIEPYFPDLDEWKATLITKSLSFSLGLVGILLGLGISMIKGGTMVQVISTFGAMTGGPCAALFFCGIFIPWVNNIGLGIAAVLGMAFGGWISVGSYLYSDGWNSLPSPDANCTSLYNTTDFSTFTGQPTTAYYDVTTLNMTDTSESMLLPLYSISFLWLRELITFVTVCLAVIISALTGIRKAETVEEQFVHPIVRYCIKLKRNVYSPPEEQAVVLSHYTYTKADCVEPLTTKHTSF